MDEYKTLEELHDEKRPVLAEMSVVIPTLGREILQESLFWIASGTYWPGQVVVVDQGQNDQVRTWLAALESRGIKTLYVPSTERGRSLGLNQGLERVATRFVAITDDDCFVRSDWLENMHASLTRYPEAIVTGQVEAPLAGCEGIAFEEAPGAADASIR
jgi:GT2 family glycosyltransferase